MAPPQPDEEGDANDGGNQAGDDRRFAEALAGVKDVERREPQRPDQLPQILADQGKRAESNREPCEIGPRNGWGEAAEREDAEAEVGNGEQEQRRVAR